MNLGKEIIVLGIFVALPTIIVWLVSRYKKHEIDKRVEIALAAIEKNSDIDIEAFFKKMTHTEKTIKEKLLNKLLIGSIFTVFGVCVYIAVAVEIYFNRFVADFFIGMSFVAVPSLGVGIAYLINYFVGQRMLKKEMEAQLEDMQKKA